MAFLIQSNDATELWSKAMYSLMNNGQSTESRSGETNESLHVLLQLDNPREKWVTNRFPPMNIAFALAELIWILNGSDKSKIINFWNQNLREYAEDSENKEHYHGAYGKRLRISFEIDQLERAYHSLKEKPSNRQTVMLIWNPARDMPLDNGSEQSRDIPCNICSLLKIRDNRLEWTQIMRSNDIFRGLPYNLVQFTGIQEIIAGWLNVEVGTYNHYSDSLHLYENDRNKVKINSVENFPPNNDSLSISKQESDIIIKNTFERMVNLLDDSISIDQVEKLAYLNSKRQSYNNMMFVISAYVAQKRKFKTLVNRLIESCTNELYKQMWRNWEVENMKNS
ncbi:hypothetical protein FACS189427_07900 [Planctomycetales bacterium]|nr:hypothetical protein FACS189427_07900 [Planctomycetales bacterium]